MSFQSYNHRAYCLLNLATQKKFESEISRASVKFKRSRLQNRNLSRLKSHYFLKVTLFRKLMIVKFRKKKFKDELAHADFKFLKRLFAKTSICALLK